MSIESNTKDNSFVSLHDNEGQTIALREKFIIAALGKNAARSFMTVTVDDGHRNTEYQVREDLDAMPSWFADLGWCKINPDYLSTIRANNGEQSEKYPYTIILRAPQAKSFITDDHPDNIIRAVKNAAAPR